MPLEQGNHVVVVPDRAHVEEQRRLAVHPKGAGRQHRALDAVRRPGAKDLAYRLAGVAAQLEVLLQIVQKPLDFLRAVEAPEHGELARRETEVFPAGEALFRHGSRKSIPTALASSAMFQT